MKELCRDIYDLYAEYEDEDEEDGCPGSPSQLLLPPTKHLTLNINVGGTVSSPILYLSAVYAMLKRRVISLFFSLINAVQK